MNVFKRYHFYQISSTNDYARELLAHEESVAVTAEYQISGRGRNNKSWEGDFGNNVYCSLGIAHKDTQDMQALVAFQALGCLAALQTLRELSGRPDFVLKYPNDVMIVLDDRGLRKICGVLVEHEFVGNDCVGSIVGIGINVSQTGYPEELRNKAISLKQLGYVLTPEDVMAPLLEKANLLLNISTTKLFGMWKKELNIIGRTVQIVDCEGSWKIENMLEDGRLQARSAVDGAKRIIDNGDSIRYIPNGPAS